MSDCFLQFDCILACRTGKICLLWRSKRQAANSVWRWCMKWKIKKLQKVAPKSKGRKEITLKQSSCVSIKIKLLLLHPQEFLCKWYTKQGYRCNKEHLHFQLSLQNVSFSLNRKKQHRKKRRKRSLWVISPRRICLFTCVSVENETVSILPVITIYRN